MFTLLSCEKVYGEAQKNSGTERKADQLKYPPTNQAKERSGAVTKWRGK